ncbi:LacI family DNA-binding transcriptional regulator [Rubellimicrobium roseum]|uniref:LacI family DNA-binding transcriptional regulator n=1 Tax=Rubellimicrobium roseum TaxID=687525 RepID=A0A5C4N8F4_9RHOB|nr:LacI family DNA-binding transcriptional regulator [Rubellimicrobium roseum]TNC68510.1 LacI family DNA-binding transcriptional regulator [Rubellimicrobium roseum]
MTGSGRTIRLRDVAEAAGVSQGTASNVFNRPEVVREEVRERVREAARALGYAGPSPKGRLLRAGKTNAIGVAAAEPLEYFFADPWARRLMTEVARACDARGAGLALVSVAAGQPGWSIESALVDGFLLRCGGRELLVEIAQRRGLPFVALSLDHAEPDVPAVDIDDFGGARLAARHLLGLGHRRLAILGIGLGAAPDRVQPDRVRATRYMNVRERARGYWAALAEAGLPEAEVPILAIRDDGSNVGAALALLFDEPEPPTGLLAMSDKVAMAALGWLAERGLAVPGQVSVMGFDGVPEGARTEPPLSTVEQPFRRIAERAVAAILDGPMPQGREVLPLTLLVRGSTGSAPNGTGA